MSHLLNYLELTTKKQRLQNIELKEKKRRKRLKEKSGSVVVIESFLCIFRTIQALSWGEKTILTKCDFSTFILLKMANRRQIDKNRK